MALELRHLAGTADAFLSDCIKEDEIMRGNLALWDNPFGLLRRLTGDMERFFDEFTGGRLLPGESRLSREARWIPSIDAFERNGSLVVRADLPGVTKDAVNVEVTENSLTISGERKKEFEEEKEGVYRHERAYGGFYRAFPLPEGVKPENVTATFSNGVLEVTAPLSAGRKEAKGRRIKIQEVVGSAV